MSAEPEATGTPTRERLARTYRRPLLDLVYAAATIHREHHDPQEVQCSSLLSIKTGTCPEDCGYCSQSAHHGADLEPEKLLDVEDVLVAARAAKAAGADRFCMGAAWRKVRDDRDFDRVLTMIQSVKALELETCVTLGMVAVDQAERLKDAGLDYYNHNLDTSREYYPEVVGTRTYDDRLETLAAVRVAGIKLCCGGILGMGESEEDRIGLLLELARQDPPPESVPINCLVPVPGTPLQDAEPLPWDQLVRAVATARIFMPQSCIRLSAGRSSLSEETQAFCFLAGANSIFLGERLLTTPNRDTDADQVLFERLGLHAGAPGV